ncbi:MAG: ABC transporter permease, partial [Terriglobia bacterium]
MSTLLQDLRYGARMLARNPGFTAVVVLTLALGIAANTSIFSIVNAFLLRPLPFDEPARLVHLWQTDQSRGWRQLRVSVPNFEEWRERSQVFEDMAGYYYGSVSLLEEEGPARVQVGNVTPNLFRVLGVEPLLGRGFEPEENRPGRQKVVVLKHSFWLRHFAGQDSVLGQSLTLDAVPYTIIGVMPPTFEFSMKATQMWRPLVLDRFRDDREANGPLLVVGRIKPELNREQAQAEMTTLARTLEQEHPVANAGKGVNIVPLREALIFFYDLVQLMFLTLFLAVGFVLLIICANIGNLLLARAVARTQEVAVRTALGASRARLLQQFLTEGLLLALLGGAAGAALAYLLVGSAAPVIPQDLYRVGEISLDTRALLFTLGASLFSVLLFGLAPALHVSRPNLAAALKEGARGASAGTRGKRLRQGLVVSEIALAVVLLVGSLLMVQSFIRLQRVETGFDTDRMLTMEIILPTSKYKNDKEENIFYDEVLRRAAALPGVEAAAGVYPLPLNFESLSKEFLLPGGTPTKPGEKLFANNFWVTPGYFKAMGIALRRGRDFTPADNAAARRVVVINRKMAERYWPNRSPVGRRL